jgi:hypothetical protein
MKTRILILILVTACSVSLAQSVPAPRTVKVYVQGDTSGVALFVEASRREFAKHGMTFQPVPFEGDFEYNIVIAQELEFKEATASVVVLDRKGLLLTSVVRSGRLSGKSAFNATARELAKKMAVLVPQ